MVEQWSGRRHGEDESDRAPKPDTAILTRIAAHKPETRRRLIALDTNPAYQTPAELREQVRRNLREWTEMAERLNLAVEG